MTTLQNLENDTMPVFMIYKAEEITALKDVIAEEERRHLAILHRETRREEKIKQKGEGNELMSRSK